MPASLAGGWMDLADAPDAWSDKCVGGTFLISETKEGKTIVPTIGS